MDKIRISSLLILALLLAAGGSYTMVLRYRAAPAATPPALEAIPMVDGGFSAVDEYLEPESLRLLGADMTIARSYRSPGGEIEFFLGYFERQQENSQIHSPKHCYPGSGWNIMGERDVRVSLEGKDLDVRELLISDGRETRLVIYWFNMSGESIPDEFALKFHQMKNALLSRPQSAAFIRFSTVVDGGDQDRARARLLGFIEEISPDIRYALSGGLKNGSED
ncbi:MAG TPA: EpsI family protein [Candidatus Krumholzibacterium sp.]|nr:EpsI family protein [Candidatus Krumholzibacterium sp.]